MHQRPAADVEYTRIVFILDHLFFVSRSLTDNLFVLEIEVRWVGHQSKGLQDSASSQLNQ